MIYVPLAFFVVSTFMYGMQLDEPFLKEPTLRVVSIPQNTSMSPVFSLNTAKTLLSAIEVKKNIPLTHYAKLLPNAPRYIATSTPMITNEKNPLYNEHRRDFDDRFERFIKKSEKEQCAYHNFYHEVARKPLFKAHRYILEHKNELQLLYTIGDDTLELMLRYAELPLEIRDEIAFKHVLGMHREDCFRSWFPTEKKQFLRTFNSLPFGKAMLQLSYTIKAKEYLTPHFRIDEDYNTISPELLCLYQRLHIAKKEGKKISLSHNEVHFIQHVMPPALIRPITGETIFGNIVAQWEESPRERVIPSILHSIETGTITCCAVHLISLSKKISTHSTYPLLDQYTPILDLFISSYGSVASIRNVLDYSPPFMHWQRILMDGSSATCSSAILIDVLGALITSSPPLYCTSHGNLQRFTIGAFTALCFAVKQGLQPARTNTIEEIYNARKKET
jgi:hypothetical protein